MPSSININIKTGARSSPLSKAQLAEVQAELAPFHPNVILEALFLDTVGDRDLKTSLRTLDKTDFFTRDIDQALLEGKCHIAIHSAKDLPDPLPQGIELIALTQGVDSSDSLVFNSLPVGAVIGTSSARREEEVKKLREDFRFIDIRGNIQQRLALLEQGNVDGVVIAEAALIRLGLTRLNRIHLQGPTAPLQGKLAIVARENDAQMVSLFSCLDSREIDLHVGLTPPKKEIERKAIHCPFIETLPRSFDTPNLLEIKNKFNQFTHLIFTSKQAVHYCMEFIDSAQKLEGRQIISVGKATQKTLESYGLKSLVTEEETAEGVCALLDTLMTKDSHFLWLHSAQARSVISDYFSNKNVSFTHCALYDTLPKRPTTLPNLDKVNRVCFTSPSCIDAFLEFYNEIPPLKYSFIGPVTQNHWEEKSSLNLLEQFTAIRQNQENRRYPYGTANGKKI